MHRCIIPCVQSMDDWWYHGPAGVYFECVTTYSTTKQDKHVTQSSFIMDLSGPIQTHLI